MDKVIVKENINRMNDGTLKEFPESLTVAGSMFLDGCTNLKKLPKILKVEGSLSLSGCTNIEEFPELLIVGGDIFTVFVDCSKFGKVLIGGKVDSPNLQHEKLENGTITDEYIYADNRLVFYEKKISQYDYDWYKGINEKEGFVVKGQYTSYCKNVKEGMIDVNYKELKDKEGNKYDYVTLDTRFTQDEAILFYRYITDACVRGCHKFLQQFIPYQETYSVKEIINLTRGLDGNEKLVEFMENKEG